MSDLILEDKLTYKIDSDEPIELNQLILSLKSLGDEYGKFSKIKDVEVKISEVRKGDTLRSSLISIKSLSETRLALILLLYS